MSPILGSSASFGNIVLGFRMAMTSGTEGSSIAATSLDLHFLGNLLFFLGLLDTVNALPISHGHSERDAWDDLVPLHCNLDGLIVDIKVPYKSISMWGFWDVNQKSFGRSGELDRHLDLGLVWQLYLHCVFFFVLMISCTRLTGCFTWLPFLYSWSFNPLALLILVNLWYKVVFKTSWTEKAYLGNAVVGGYCTLQWQPANQAHEICCKSHTIKHKHLST